MDPKAYAINCLDEAVGSPELGSEVVNPEQGFALFPPLSGRHRGKGARKEAYAERARRDLTEWIA